MRYFSITKPQHKPKNEWYRPRHLVASATREARRRLRIDRIAVILAGAGRPNPEQCRGRWRPWPSRSSRDTRVSVAACSARRWHHGIHGAQSTMQMSESGAPRLYSRGPSGIFGETRRSMSSFAKASEDTRCAFLHGLTAVASCVGG